MVQTYLLWHLALFCSIHFAAGELIRYTGFPEQLLHGGCKKECGKADDEIKRINCDPSYKYCVLRPEIPSWFELKEIFEIDQKKECLDRDESPRRVALTGTVCRQTCLLNEEYITGIGTSCLPGLVCCKSGEESPWSAFKNLIVGL